MNLCYFRDDLYGIFNLLMVHYHFSVPGINVNVRSSSPTASNTFTSQTNTGTETGARPKYSTPTTTVGATSIPKTDSNEQNTGRTFCVIKILKYLSVTVTSPLENLMPILRQHQSILH